MGIRHPNIVVEHDPERDEAKVVPLSHNPLPGLTTQPAEKYGLDRWNYEGTRVSVSTPFTVHPADKLKPMWNNPDARVSPEHLETLKADIGKILAKLITSASNNNFFYS